MRKAIAALALLLPAICLAASSALSQISISVSPSTWNIGYVNLGDIVNTSGDHFTVSNSSTVQIDLTISVGNSIRWTFADNPGTEQFAMDFSKNGGAVWTASSAGPPLRLFPKTGTDSFLEAAKMCAFTPRQAGCSMG